MPNIFFKDKKLKSLNNFRYLHATNPDTIVSNLKKPIQHLNELQIIEGCRKGDAAAQRELYDRFGATMMGICCRYAPDRTVAEDLLHDGFITVFTKIGEFRSEGSFEGWCKRIFINTSLGFLRKRDPVRETEHLDDVAWLGNGESDAVEKMSGEELIGKITSLPDGYRTILNLYAIEGYSHKEIGEMLGISENTSRSQYFRARGRLMEMIENDGNSGRSKEMAALHGAGGDFKNNRSGTDEQYGQR